MILILIIVFWFTHGYMLFLISQDDVLGELYDSETNFTKINETSYYLNQTQSTSTSDDVSRSAISDSLGTMWLFGINQSFYPNGLAVIISFINWLFFLISIICIYRILNPLA